MFGLVLLGLGRLNGSGWAHHNESEENATKKAHGQERRRHLRADRDRDIDVRREPLGIEPGAISEGGLHLEGR